MYTIKKAVWNALFPTSNALNRWVLNGTRYMLYPIHDELPEDRATIAFCGWGLFNTQRVTRRPP